VAGAMGDADTFQRFGDAALALARRDLAVEEGDFDILLYVQVVDEVEALEDEADAPRRRSSVSLDSE
jgi:hypothetical protein